MSDATIDTFWPALCRHGRQWLDRFTTHIDKALNSGDMAAVHGLRVASRRLTEPLLLLEQADGKRPRRARRALKKLRDAFGPLRDIDVLTQSLHDPQVAVPLVADACERLNARLDRRREKSLDQARRRCPHDDCRQLVEDLDSLFTHARPPPEGLDANALRAMLQSRLEALHVADPRREGEPDLHETRIAVKRLRYCGELAVRVDPDSFVGWIDKLTVFQRLLGEWNDHVVAAQWIAREAGQRGHLACRTAFSAELLAYAAGRAARAHDLRHNIIEQWGDFVTLLTTHATPPPSRPQLAVSA